MERRFLLGVVVAALAGCAGGGPSDGGSSGGGSADGPAITGRQFTDTGECGAPETASVAFDSSAVHVTGCITGANGCSTAVLGSATLDGDELRVVVDTDDSAPPGGGCTQALVYRGYDARVAFDGLPASVVVVHDSARGREEVARATRP